MIIMSSIRSIAWGVSISQCCHQPPAVLTSTLTTTKSWSAIIWDATSRLLDLSAMRPAGDHTAVGLIDSVGPWCVFALPVIAAAVVA